MIRLGALGRGWVIRGGGGDDDDDAIAPIGRWRRRSRRGRGRGERAARPIHLRADDA